MHVSFSKLVLAVVDNPCVWDSLTGATFDITSLIKRSSPPYEITDGDIPCTLNKEQNYSYLFNFCNNVDLTFAPPECRQNQVKNNWKVRRWEAESLMNVASYVLFDVNRRGPRYSMIRLVKLMT